MTRLGSLCTGMGGLDLAVDQVYGVEHVWHAEIDPDASRVLAAHWPDVPNLGDLTAVDWASVEPVDILTAGYPCQPLSAAGRRKGADDERWIWPDVFTAVRVLRPRLVVLENVAGHLSLGFGQVLGDLASAGFDAEWGCVRASDVGAPHRRERAFILAWPADPEGVGHRDVGTASVTWLATATVTGAATHADGDTVRQQPIALARRVDTPVVGGTDAGAGVLTLLPTPRARDSKGRDPNPRGVDLNEAVALLPTPRTNDMRGPGAHGDGGPDLRTAVALLPTPRANDSKGTRRVGYTHHGMSVLDVVQLLPTPKGSDGRHGGPGQRSGNGRTDLALPSTVVQHADRWGDYAPAIARWEHILGRPAPDPTELGTRGQPRLSPRFVEWLMGLPDGWVTDHLPRNAALRLLGNGVVPQQAMHAIRELVSP